MNHAEKVKRLSRSLQNRAYSHGMADQTDYAYKRQDRTAAESRAAFEILCTAIDEMQAEIDRLTVALNPRRWTQEHNDAWHKNLPDASVAFEALRKVGAMKERGEGA